MAEPTFEQYMQLEGEAAEHSFRVDMERAGYFAFYRYVENFRNALRAYADGEADRVAVWLERGERLFPAPEKFSPSWEGLWQQFRTIWRAKNEALAKIPAAARAGEWQIVLDNPYTTQPVVCYPGLTFHDAAYMYAYFGIELKPHENLRLQKVAELLTTTGSRELSLFPDK